MWASRRLGNGASLHVQARRLQRPQRGRRQSRMSCGCRRGGGGGRRLGRARSRGCRTAVRSSESTPATVMWSSSCAATAPRRIDIALGYGVWVARLSADEADRPRTDQQRRSPRRRPRRSLRLARLIGRVGELHGRRARRLRIVSGYVRAERSSSYG